MHAIAMPTGFRLSAERVLPAAVFGVLALLRVAESARIASALTQTGDLAETVRLASRLTYMLLGTAFMLLLATLFLWRYRALSRASGLRSTLVAVAGTWAPMVLGSLPVTSDGLGATLLANALLIVGLGLSCWALWTLGRHFGIRPSARGLVTHGPYARVRHPLYASEALAVLGMLVPVMSPLAIVVVVVALLLQARRAANEEEVLTTAFPAYSDYRARTARFIPGVL